METTERGFIRILELWRDARTNRANITKTTRYGIIKRCNALVYLLQTDNLLSEQTVMKVLEMPGQYSYRHRLAKKLLWCCRWASENGLLTENPLRKVKIPRPKFDHRKVFLTVSDIQSIKDLPLTGWSDRVRDCFLLQCYTGVAYVDIKKITKLSIYKGENLEFIVLYRGKTGTKFTTVLRPEAKAILEKWNYQLNPPCNQVYNRKLHELGKMAALDQPLFSHLGRKTFAQYYTERGVNLQITADMMGIRDIRTLTAHYATISTGAIEQHLKASGL